MESILFPLKYTNKFCEINIEILFLNQKYVEEKREKRFIKIKSKNNKSVIRNKYVTPKKFIVRIYNTKNTKK